MIRRRISPALLLAVLVTGALAVVGGYRALTRDPPVDRAGPVHVHGLGVDPADGILVAATHTGLFRIDDEGRATRVGNRFQDTMGFVAVGAGSYLASGHPDLRDRHLQRDGRPPLLGLVESRDAGRTWRSLSLLGEADFHDLAVAGEDLYGYDATGQRVLVTTDRIEWEERAAGVALADLAADPKDAEHLVAARFEGGVAESRDGGRTWTDVTGAPPAVAVAWATGELIAVTSDGTVHAGGTGGEGVEWVRRGRLTGEPEALAVAGERLLAATTAGIFESNNGGRSWRQRYRARVDNDNV